MAKLLPILLVLAGLGGGIAAGLVLRPDPEAEAQAEAQAGEVECRPPDAALEGEKTPAVAKPPAPDEAVEYVDFGTEFIVPVMKDKAVEAMMVLTLSIEVPEGSSEAIYARQPRLRDAFLQVLFDHANIGGFGEDFLDRRNLDALRQLLLESAHSIVGPIVREVLIVNYVRQQV